MRASSPIPPHSPGKLHPSSCGDGRAIGHHQTNRRLARGFRSPPHRSACGNALDVASTDRAAGLLATLEGATRANTTLLPDRQRRIPDGSAPGCCSDSPGRGGSDGLESEPKLAAPDHSAHCHASCRAPGKAIQHGLGTSATPAGAPPASPARRTSEARGLIPRYVPHRHFDALPDCTLQQPWTHELQARRRPMNVRTRHPTCAGAGQRAAGEPGR